MSLLAYSGSAAMLRELSWNKSPLMVPTVAAVARAVRRHLVLRLQVRLQVVAMTYSAVATAVAVVAVATAAVPTPHSRMLLSLLSLLCPVLRGGCRTNTLALHR